MLYEDEKVLTIDEYEKIAREYMRSYGENQFKFINAEDDKEKVDNAAFYFSAVSRSLFCLGGFLNTSRLYALTCKQIKAFEELYGVKLPNTCLPRGDKPKLFLQYNGYESALILALFELSRSSNHSAELERMIVDRLVLCKNIYACK